MILPLLLPITLAVWLLTFMVNFRELSIDLLLGGAVIMAVMLLAVGGLARRFVGTRLGT